MTDSDENPPYDARISLSLIAFDCDPDDISAHLGLQPNHLVRKGQSFPPPRHPDYRAKHNLWALRFELDLPDPLPHCIDMALLLKPLRAALETRLDKLATLPPCRSASIRIYVIPWQLVPGFEFASEDLDFLKRTGLPFEIDIQNFGPDDEV